MTTAGSARAQDVAPPQAGAGDAPAADKSGFTLFNPTPRPLMRDLAADRPDATESPYTVDAGHVQLEASFIEYAQSRGGPDADAFAVAPFNVKVGLLNDVDLQLVVAPYVEENPDDGPTDNGLGDTQLRLKINLFGNDGGDAAFAFMPFVELPTADDSTGAEGGLIFPFAVALGERAGLGLQAEVDFVRDDGGDYEVELSHTAVLGFDVTDRVGAYVEYIGVEPFADGADYRAAASAGATYAVSDDVQLDAGVVVGLTDDVEDYVVFSGITIRL